MSIRERQRSSLHPRRRVAPRGFATGDTEPVAISSIKVSVNTGHVGGGGRHFAGGIPL